MSVEDDARLIEDRADVAALRRAAHVVRRRSRKPNNILQSVLRRILTDLADTIEDEIEDAS